MMTMMMCSMVVVLQVVSLVEISLKQNSPCLRIRRLGTHPRASASQTRVSSIRRCLLATAWLPSQIRCGFHLCSVECVSERRKRVNCKTVSNQNALVLTGIRFAAVKKTLNLIFELQKL